MAILWEKEKQDKTEIYCVYKIKKMCETENDPGYTWAQILFLFLFCCFCPWCGFEQNRKEFNHACSVCSACVVPFLWLHRGNISTLTEEDKTKKITSILVFIIFQFKYLNILKIINRAKLYMIMRYCSEIEKCCHYLLAIMSFKILWLSSNNVAFLTNFYC